MHKIMQVQDELQLFSTSIHSSDRVYRLSVKGCGETRAIVS